MMRMNMRSKIVRETVERILDDLAAKYKAEPFLAYGYLILTQAKGLLSPEDEEAVWRRFEELAKRKSD